MPPESLTGWIWFGTEMTIRVDEDGTPWLMNRPDAGWGEYGHPTTWERLSRINHVTFTRGEDSHGRLILMKRVQQSRRGS